MSRQLDDQFLLQTFIETDQTLSQWEKILVKDQRLELGDDPQLVQDIESDLRRLSRQLRYLGPHFDLSRVPLREANHYFAAAHQLDRTLAFVEAVNRKSYGSRQNTYQCLDQIKVCLDHIHDAMDVSTLASSGPAQ